MKINFLEVIYMCTFCPKCGRISEYDPYYERMYCTSCNWSSEREIVVQQKSKAVRALTKMKIRERKALLVTR
jgi:uncharacterized OB-fold protein